MSPVLFKMELDIFRLPPFLTKTAFASDLSVWKNPLSSFRLSASTVNASLSSRAFASTLMSAVLLFVIAKMPARTISRIIINEILNFAVMKNSISVIIFKVFSEGS